MIDESDAVEVGAHLGGALEQAGHAYAIGGALAYGFFGIPRATNDVDLNMDAVVVNQLRDHTLPGPHQHHVPVLQVTVSHARGTQVLAYINARWRPCRVPEIYLRCFPV